MARGAVAAALLLLAGCSTLERQGGGPDVSIPPVAPSPPEAAPKTLAESPNEAERKRLIALYGGEYRWPRAENYLNDVLVRLAKASETPGQPYRVTILNSGVVNAFALPSGDLFVTRGLLALANDTSEVAAVMAHEIAHVTARHAFLRAEQEKKAAVIAQAASVIQSRQKGKEVEASSAMTIAGFSRQQELDADQIGIGVTARAGYDPFGGSRFLKSLARSSAFRASLMGQKGAEKPDFLASHPSTPERIDAALQAARQIGGPGLGEAARAPYLAAIGGMAFGDDPTEGAIRGRKFIHPRLGFAFEAPEGFVLENSSQAVLGVADGGAEALRLDSVRTPQGKTLAEYLNSGWIDGLLESSIQSAEINGMPTVLAHARAGEWNFRVAVIAFHEDFYRIIFAVKALTPEADERFIRSIRSFAPMTPEEAARAQPLHLRLAIAGPIDSAESLAAKMTGVDRSLDQFLLLNELESPALRLGETYKLVTN
ncbi:M48 family metalloprotease [uncultured Rhodoblastus sp.]|uniref:M48 family metalloprotease n=1 Tax=uncultured Rhodoblastus sp. TaxID=543037 RepID=UPI0025CCB848|nr:M48 family metalloprotease [uncultured Rhodoblastus sp.]